MADLEDTARYAIKLDPGGTLAWLLPGLDQDLAFDRWLDTNLITYPGEPERHCDTVARLQSASGTQPPWAAVVEVEARPRKAIRVRLLEYLCRFLRRVRDGLNPRERYLAAGAVIVLTGRLRGVPLDMRLPNTKALLRWRPRVVCLARRSAAKALARVAAGGLSRGVLPWVPLMGGGGDAAVVAEWVRVAGQEPDEDRRRDWAGLVKVFADRVGCLPVWEKALEGWAMWKSKVIEEWRNDGRAQGIAEGQHEERRGNLLRLMELRFPGQVTEELSRRVAAEPDLNKLKQWFDLAATAASIDPVRAAVLTP
ncbi:MAG: hypothetical protein ACRC33_14830 [Gemmataceae bacterium]